MGNTAFLIPLEGLLVRDPVSKEILPASGGEKPMIGPEGRYWKRRIRDGSVKVYLPLEQNKQREGRGKQ